MILDPDDAMQRKIVGDAYREGMRAFLDNMSGDSIGAINDAMQDAGARAAIAALRAYADRTTSENDTHQEYLGDGVYISFDGYQIWLAVNHPNNRVVALDPIVLRALLIFEERLRGVQLPCDE